MGGTVITGMVDPKVPSFWPHNETWEEPLSLVWWTPRFPASGPTMRHGRHTRPGWTLLRMRSTKKSIRIEKTASYWSKHLVLQMHLELVTWCRVVDGYI